MNRTSPFALPLHNAMRSANHQLSRVCRNVLGTLVAAMLAVLLMGFSPISVASAQQNTASPNQANWDLFERFSSSALNRFVHSTSVSANWINETDSLWYAWADRDGRRYYLVIPSGPTKRYLFDHDRMASELSKHVSRYLESHNLRLRDIEFEEDGKSFEFHVNDTHFSYNLDTGKLTNLGPWEEEEEEEERPWRRFSPDSTAFVYAEDHDLYFVEIVDGVQQEAVRLTEDGESNYSFGSRTPPRRERDDTTATRVRSSAVWSEDSRAFYITRSDRREIRMLYLVDVLAEPRPRLSSYRYVMPGEDEVSLTELFVFHRDAEERELREMDVDRWRHQRISNLHWTNGESDKLRLVRQARSRRVVELIEVDVATDDISSLIMEDVERGRIITQSPRYLGEDNSGDFIWYSRSSGWAHYYLYDHAGNLKNPITSGNWNVRAIRELDRDERRLWLTGVGREAGENVNFTHLYRVNVDGTGFTVLDPGNADHRSSLSPSRRFVLNNYSRVDVPPRAVLRDNRGRPLLQLEEMDISELEELGWRAPEPFMVKAADGVTDIYGNMWKPFDFDPERSYPIIAHVYPGPQQESVRLTFGATGAQQQLAQLGFIVVQIGNRGGTPLRSAAYHSHGYFNLRDYGLADKKAGIEQLAKRHSWIDVSRVGIHGHSGGGFMSAAALLVPPYNEFFTVGVASAGNHDNNVYNQSWSENNHGLEVHCVPKDVAAQAAADQDADDTDAPGDTARAEKERVANELACNNGMDVEFEIEVPANHEVAGNLKGRLLLQHGDMDNNVHHAGTMRLVRELIRQDKRFDFIMFPGMRHGFSGQYSRYWNQMRAEYFATHLLGDRYQAADMEVMR